jgi:ferritin
MPAQRFVDALNEQVANEFAASQQYVAVAVHYDSQTLPQLAHFFYRQSVEERNHAMIMVQYLLDTDSQITVPGVAPPQYNFDDIVAPVALALDQERGVSDEIGQLAAIARDERDYQSEQFIQWFLKEQVEEVATMSELFDVVERSKDNPMMVEEYVARENPGAHAQDPTAPAAAGGSI